MPEASRRVNPQPLIIFATIFLLVAALSLARAVLIPVALAILLSFMLVPVVRVVQRYGLKRIPAVIMVSVVAFVLMAMLVSAILSQFMNLANNLPSYESNILVKIRSMRQGESSVLGSLVRMLERVTKEIDQPDESGKKTEKGPAANRPLPVVVRTDLQQFLSPYAQTAHEAIRLAASAGVVIALVIVMLIFREELRDRFIRLTGSSRLTVTTKALDEAARRISDYILRKSMVNGVFGGIIAALLVAIGVPFAIVWGFLVAVLRFIPGLGIWLSALPPLILSWIAFESWGPFAMVAVIFVIVELLSINVFEPRFVGPQIGLLPVATMVSLTFWTWLWGPVGMVLAIPLTVCIAVLGKYVPQLSFLSVLLSDQPAMDTALRYYQRLLANDLDEASEIVETFLQTHDREAVHDRLLIPALSCARRDIALGELAKTDLDFFCVATNEILDDLEAFSASAEMIEPASRSIIVGCPVWDTGDRLALQMLAQQLRSRGYTLEISNPGLLSSEVVNWIASKQPAVVCLASIAPGELAQSRFVCKRLRQHSPQIKIVVARLGLVEEKDKPLLLAAGADVICTTIAETRNELIQLTHLKAERLQMAAVGQN